ncbi:MAG: DUF4097 family beta strand repeat-containing protein [Gemmatimonadota bacterium]
MHRPSIFLLLAALTVATPAPSTAQSSTSERERERRAEREERAREAREQAAEKAREKAERAREKEAERQERLRAASVDTTVTFDARGTLSVSCPGGTVVVIGSERNELRVRARTESGAIRFTSSGGRATLEPASGRGCNDGRFEVTVPVGARVTAVTWSGSLSVRGVHGDLELHTQSGDIDVRDAGNRLDIDALSGDIQVTGVTGETNVSTVSGSLTLTGARGNVVVSTVSGDMDLRDVIAKQVRAHTTNGDVTYQGSILEAGRYEFNTHSGEIDLHLPADIGAELSVSTFNGGIESDFPITLKAGEHGIGSAQAKRLNFTVGRGTARIIAETFSGDITLRRRSR